MIRNKQALTALLKNLANRKPLRRAFVTELGRASASLSLSLSLSLITHGGEVAKETYFTFACAPNGEHINWGHKQDLAVSPKPKEIVSANWGH